MRCLSVFLTLIICSVSIAAGAGTAEAAGHALTRFCFSRWGEMKPRTWEVLWEESGCTFRENGDKPRPFAPELATELARVVADNDMESWSGVYTTGYEVLDGECFSLEMEFADGTTVNASGDNAFPDRYDEAVEAMMAIFEKEKTDIVAGRYKYVGDGFGGDFTITLNADGTYTFCEGPLSSYVGTGTWSIAYDAVYMNDDTELELSFTFGVESDTLIYLAWGSDAFLHVELPDEARFVRLNE